MRTFTLALATVAALALAAPSSAQNSGQSNTGASGGAAATGGASSGGGASQSGSAKSQNGSAKSQSGSAKQSGSANMERSGSSQTSIRGESRGGRMGSRSETRTRIGVSGGSRDDVVVNRRSRHVAVSDEPASRTTIIKKKPHGKFVSKRKRARF